jgi:hypothetical protein
MKRLVAQIHREIQLGKGKGLEIRMRFRRRLTETLLIKQDGWLEYRSTLRRQSMEHGYVIIGSGKEMSNLLPRFHAMLGNIKENIRGVTQKHLQRYLNEFCCRLNARFWEDQVFDGLLSSGLSSPTRTFSELKA